MHPPDLVLCGPNCNLKRGTMRKILLTLCLSLVAAAPALAEPKQYSVHAPTVTLKAGGTGAATLTIKADAGFHFNKDFPAKFTVEATAFAKSAKEALTTKAGDVKVAGNDGVITIPLQGLAAGTGPVTVTGNFGICNAETCFMLRGEKLTLQVAVK